MTVTRKFPRARPFRRTALEVKALVRFRDGYRCQGCGMTARENWRRYKQALDVHRLVPGSRYTLKGSLTLCRECHLHAHGRKPRDPNEARVVLLMPVDLLAVIEAEADAQDRTRTAEIVRAIKGHYRSAGLWPPRAISEGN